MHSTEDKNLTRECTSLVYLWWQKYLEGAEQSKLACGMGDQGEVHQKQLQEEAKKTPSKLRMQESGVREPSEH